MIENKTLEQIEEADLQALVQNSVDERRTLEYKREIDFDEGRWKDELLKDVSALANASGGLLIVGIDEESGAASKVVGVETDDIDSYRLRIEQTIRSNLDPQIPGLRTHPVPLDDGRCAVVIKVPVSFAKPHRITRGRNQFYSRSAAGTHQMDTAGLRVAFDLATSLRDRIEAFRSERLSNIKYGSTPVPLQKGVTLVLHVVPLNAFEPDASFDAQALKTSAEKVGAFLGAMSFNRMNFDGYVRHNSTAQPSTVYIQLFRGGQLEIVVGGSKIAPEEDVLQGSYLESYIIDFLDGAVHLYNHLDVSPPFAVMISLLGARGYKMKNPLTAFSPRVEIDRDYLVAPTAYIEERTFDAALEGVKPAIEAIWNAGGFSQSPTLGRLLRERRKR